MFQCRLVQTTVVTVTKVESHNNSNISEYKMRFFLRQTQAWKYEQAKQ